LEEHCAVIKTAVFNTITKHNFRTADIGGSKTTTEFMKKVVEEIKVLTPEIGRLFKYFFITIYVDVYLKKQLNKMQKEKLKLNLLT
jgi:hypothetical protein